MFGLISVRWFDIGTVRYLSRISDSDFFYKVGTNTVRSSQDMTMSYRILVIGAPIQDSK